MTKFINWFEAHVQPYWLRHAVIAWAIQTALTPFIGDTWATVCAAGFYFLHEMHDLFVLHKNDNRMDWRGLLAPLAATILPWAARQIHALT